MVCDFGLPRTQTTDTEETGKLELMECIALMLQSKSISPYDQTEEQRESFRLELLLQKQKHLILLNRHAIPFSLKNN